MRFKDDNGWEWAAVIVCCLAVVFGAASFGWVWWDAGVSMANKFRSH